MSDPTPTIGEPQDEFGLSARADRSLRELVDEGDFDSVHFFIEEGIDEDAISLGPTDDDTSFALLPYEHPDSAIDDDTFELIEEAGYEQANLRDLLNFAIERPEIQREYNIVALGTLRTRKIYEDREGESVWNQSERDRSICQWVMGLSHLKSDRTLVPVEIYLDDILRHDALLLVRTSS